MLRVSHTNSVIKLIMNDPPMWATQRGVEIRHVDHNHDGTITMRFGAQPADTLERSRVTGYYHAAAKGWAFQFGSREARNKLPEIFGMVVATRSAAGDDYFEVDIPAERPAVRPSVKTAKPTSPPKPVTAVAVVKESLRTMSKESPPPDFKPAIPLREAVDTINAYKLTEGDALELSFSRRGHLKVKYEYGG